MMNRIAYIMIALVFAALKTNAQPKEYYFKSSEMKGFPSSLKQLANYGSVHQKLGYFQLDEKTYNRLFYRSFITENSPNAGFRRMDIILTKPTSVKPVLFPGHELVLNPKLSAGQYSKHPLRINIREESISAVFETDFIEWKFPRNVLRTKKDSASSVLVGIDNIEFHNDGSQNKYHGILIKGVKGFSMEPAFIPDSFVEITDYKNAEIKFLAEEAFVYPNLVFENTKLTNLIHAYKQNNKSANIKLPNQYKSSILLKNVAGKANFSKSIACEISEIYFFENVIAGVIDFPAGSKKQLLQQLNLGNTAVNRGDVKLKPNGNFPTIQDFHKNTYYKVEQDGKSVKMYFIIVK